MRVGQGDLRLRNPLPGVTDVRQAFLARRHPRFIVVSLAWAWRFLRPPAPLPFGRIYSPLELADFRNSDGRIYFSALARGMLGYRLAHSAHYQGLWPMVHIHDSLDEPVWIFERAS